MNIGKFILAFALIPFFSEGQVLLDLLDNARHFQEAGFYKANNIKRTWFTMEIPFPLYMSISTDHIQDSSSWATDTITFSKSFSKSGWIENEMQTLPNGDIYSLKEFFFDSLGTLLKTRETNNERIRYYDFQEMTYNYKEGQVLTIFKLRLKNTDTVRTTTIFSYNQNKLVNVCETDNSSGDTLLLSKFIYNSKKNYVEESSFIKEFCEVRTNFYYTLDNKGRIVKVAHGLEGYKRNLKPDREISYDNDDIGFINVERYEL